MICLFPAQLAVKIPLFLNFSIIIFKFHTAPPQTIYGNHNFMRLWISCRRDPHVMR